MTRPITQEIARQQKEGVLLVLTGPTGAGKDTLFAALQKKHPLKRIITTTSRDMRPNESEGDPYYFTTRETFEQMIADGAFFEWVEFRGHLYGTQRKTLQDALKSGRDVIWHIDAKGVKNIKEKVKEMTKRSVFVFLTAPSIDVLESRVHKDEGVVMHRWNQALVSWELDQYDDCDYLVVNEDEKLVETVFSVEAIMEAKRREILQ